MRGRLEIQFHPEFFEDGFHDSSTTVRAEEQDCHSSQVEVSMEFHCRVFQM